MAVALELFGVEALHDANADERSFNLAKKNGGGSQRRPAGAAHFLAELFHRQAHQRREDDDENGELQADAEGEDECHERLDGLLDALAEDGFEAVLEGVDIGDEPASDIAGALRAEGRKGNAQNAVVEAFADISRGENGGFIGEMFLEIPRDVAHQRDTGQQAEDGCDRGDGIDRQNLNRL